MVIFRSFFFQDISMKLGGHMGHGPNSSYHDVWQNMSCCHWIMTENVLKNGQMNVRIVKSQEEMGKIHSYHDTWLPALNIFLYEIFRWPLTWPRYRSKVRKRLNPYFLPGFFRNFTRLIPEDPLYKPHRGSMYGISDLTYFARSRDLKLVCQVTLNWETRISPVSLYIQAGLGPCRLRKQVPIIISWFYVFTCDLCDH